MRFVLKVRGGRGESLCITFPTLLSLSVIRSKLEIRLTSRICRKLLLQHSSTTRVLQLRIFRSCFLLQISSNTSRSVIPKPQPFA